MNHLGGMEGMVCVEWSCKSSMLGKTCASPSPVCWGKLGISLVECHPGTKGFEMPYVKKILVHPHGIMGSSWIIYVAITLPDGQLVVVGDRFGTRPFWSKGRLLKGPVLVKIKSCGESAPPLQSVKPKYLAMSLVKDNLSIKTWKLSRISSSQFSKLKLVVEQGLKDHQFLLGDALGKFLLNKNLVFFKR